MSSKVASAKPWSPAVGLAGPHEAAPEDRAASGADNGVVGPNERWSVDFMRASLQANGRCFRILNLVDDDLRECVGHLVDFSIF